jgi:hypothetical protein
MGAGAAECAVCLDRIGVRASVQLRCGHAFHRACIERWLAAGGTTCPVCRGPCETPAGRGALPPPAAATPVQLAARLPLPAAGDALPPPEELLELHDMVALERVVCVCVLLAAIALLLTACGALLAP